jgi:OmpA-OmpF porin, OOP family
VFVLGCVAWLSSSRHAVGAQDVQRFQPALDENGFLGLDTSRTPGALRGSAFLFSDLAFDPVQIQSAGGASIRLRERLMLHLGAELGLWGRGAIAFYLPMVLQQHQELSDASGTRTRQNDVFAMADPQLSARFRFLGASMADANEPHDGPGLALQLGTALPLGQHSQVSADGMPLPSREQMQPFTSDGAVRTDLALLGDFQVFGAGIGGSLGWRHHFWDPHSLVASVTGVSDEMTFGAAIKLPIPPVPALSGVLEARGLTGFKSARDTALELDLGARLKLGDFLVVLGGGFGLTNGVGVPDGRIILGVYGSVPDDDQDKDGVPDARDACIYLPEDLDGFQDSDGCPDPDNDADLVPDVDDKCPNVAAEEGRDENEDGCTDP